MAWKAALFVLAVFIAATDRASASKKKYDGYQLFTLTPKTTEDLDYLEDLKENNDLQLDFWSDIGFLRSIDVLVSKGNVDAFKDLLDRRNIGYNQIYDNVQKAVDAESKEQMSLLMKSFHHGAVQSVVGRYARYNEYVAWLKVAVNAASKIASLQSIGNTNEGRPMMLLTICGPSGTCGKKPGIFIEGGMHAREWASPAVVAYIIEKLLTGYTRDDAVTELVNTFDWYILPITNIDGYEYSHTTDRFWRKTRSDQMKFCKGVDPNRNFDFHFAEAGVSKDPCAYTYPGRAPFSEACTNNIRKFLEPRKDDFILYLAFHAYSQLVLTPYGFPYERPPDYIEMDRVGQVYADTILQHSGKEYTVGAPHEIIYAAAGGSYDWAKGTLGIKYSYTIELRPTGAEGLGFELPADQIIPCAQENWNALKEMAKSLKL